MNIVKAIELIMDDDGEKAFDNRKEAIETIMDKCGVVFIDFDWTKVGMHKTGTRKLIEKSELHKDQPFDTEF